MRGSGSSSTTRCGAVRGTGDEAGDLGAAVDRRHLDIAVCKARQLQRDGCGQEREQQSLKHPDLATPVSPIDGMTTAR